MKAPPTIQESTYIISAVVFVLAMMAPIYFIHKNRTLLFGMHKILVTSENPLLFRYSIVKELILIKVTREFTFIRLIEYNILYYFSEKFP